ncbi:MAG: hypothetical protein U0L91_04905 [Gemmiger sp.]|uniref:hypothetical protein n=1 Tax=Gemmiger sp. TaxID=2049027 RepID=UPI002E77D27D|nr:hypothetical protein [Gemmiger sp.]MEE0800601.1 hypothetical protein [Gemmiger sp.]
MVTKATLTRWLLAVVCVMALTVVLAVPALAEDADYEETLDRLSRLQNLAEQYVQEQNTDDDPIDLTLGFTRVGDYNTTIWQLTAGVRDSVFEKYATDQDADLWNLQGINTVVLPNGQSIDFGHLLASMNLVYRGIPITGSWGGDCMQLAQVYAGQAGDRDGYISLMQQTFGIEDDGTVSKFGDQDLRADLDSVVVGSQITADSSIADLLRDYYSNLTDYDRASRFIGMSFGTTDTSDTETFRNTVYNTLTGDTGMQLLLYMNGMWSADGWTVAPDSEPALRGACAVLADYLSQAVNGEKIKSSSTTLMHTMAGEALVDALNAIGDSDAASSAQQALNNIADSVTSNPDSSAVDQALDGAAEKLRTDFNTQAFQYVLFGLGGVALFGVLLCVILLLTHKHRRS